MAAIASGSDLLSPLSRGRVAARSATAGSRGRIGEGDAAPPAVASLLDEARASARAEVQARPDQAGAERHRLAASAAGQGAAGLSVDDPRFPVFPPAFPVESLIVALDRGIAAYRATQALDVAARPTLKLASGGETRAPTTA